MFRPKSLKIKRKKNPTKVFMEKLLNGVDICVFEIVPNGIWCDNDDISLLDPSEVELINNYEKYFVIGTDVVGEVCIDDFSLKYASLTPDNFSSGAVVKNAPVVTREKLEALTVVKLKEFVNAGSESFQDAVDLRLKKTDMIEEILVYFEVGNKNKEKKDHGKK